ncbi:MAG: YfhO family protein [Saprospiraceae bacterium]|nr:YfhO family protein [Saprospiraceae bacterium]
MNTILKNSLPHVLAILVFLVLSVVYFSPQLNGLVLQQGDILQYLGMAQEAKEFEEKTGETTLWTNSMFGGMPTYQIRTVVNGNQMHWVDKLARFNIPNPIGRFFAAMLGFYILMILLGVKPWLSAIGAVSFGFTTNSMLLFEAGHNTKVAAISYFPILVSGLLLIFRKKYILGGILFALGLGLDLFANHVQMTYYLFLTLIIYGVAQLVHCIKNNDMMHFAKASGIALLGLLLGVGSTASNLYMTYEYSKDTTRGEPILKSETGQVNSSSETDGLDWEYAMQWSNGTTDLFASLIPGVVGGGSNEQVKSGSPLFDDPNWSRLIRGNGGYAPLYWGDLPFTSGPSYFGAGIFLLFFVGLFLVKGPIKWWLGLGTLLTFLLSMGKNMAFINEFFFYYFPLFNKFRTPNSVLSITSFLVPVLAILALHKIIIKDYIKEEALKALYIGGGIMSAICLYFIVLGPGMYDFSSAGDQRYAQAGLDITALIEARAHHMRMDAIRSLVIALLTGGLLWAYLQDRLKQVTAVVAGIAIIGILDIWTVSKRYLNEDNFVRKTNYDSRFRPTAADEQILKDKSLNFRVMDLSESTFQSSRASYYHKSIGGYHAAKLQRFNDIIQRHLSQGNQSVLNMLNTKYFIMQAQAQGQSPQAQQNPGALGNAWLVGNIQMVNTANEEIDALTNLQAAETAIIHQEFKDYVTGWSPTKSGTITLTDYKPNHLTYQYNSDSDQLAVFSEIWYDKGWQAYIDGQPVDHIRANYILRAMKIPSGNHKVEFKFDPQSYRTGVMVSMLFSSLILFSLIGFIGYNGYQYYQHMPKETPPAPQPKKEAPQKTARSSRKSNNKKRKK